MKETNISKLCQYAAAECGATVLRNNRGLFLTLDGKRRVRAGLEANGSADLIGWTKDGIFLAIEIKTPTGRVSPAQDKFIKLVKYNGGTAFVARSPEDVHRHLS